MTIEITLRSGKTSKIEIGDRLEHPNVRPRKPEQEAQKQAQ